MSAPDPLDREWAALSRLLDDALDLPPVVRSRWVANLPAEHDALRPRLRALLCESGPEVGEGFLHTIPKVDGDGSRDECFDDPVQPPDIGAPYRIVRKLGEGGMGTVWLAHRTDVMVNRLVALKLPRRAWLGWRFHERIAEEREILAALDHPNIARLYDAGIATSGQPYLALEYVAGMPIDVYVQTRRLTVRERLRLFLLVARAVAHAHGRMIVHGDLKPSNVLVTDAGDVKLLDFGIARLLRNGGGDDPEAGAAPECLLTPEYASPEQRAGGALGTATDVYSSGVMLYELLAGARPGGRARRPRVVPPDAIGEGAPVGPSEAAVDTAARRVLRGDIDAIVLKALRTRPDERYPTMDAMADDIERYLARLPVRARPDTVGYRLTKWVSRNRLTFTAATFAIAALLTGTVVATWNARVAALEKAHAEEVRDFLSTLIRDASPYDAGGRAPSALEWLRRARDRVDRRLESRPEARVELLNLVGSSLLTLQDTDGAEEALSRAVEEGTRRLGPRHAQTLRARVLMAAVDRFRGRTAKMRAELAALLPIFRADTARFAEDLAVALKNQAHLEMDEGHYDAAERAAREELDVARRTLGPDHPETVTAQMMQALTYQFSRSPAEALEATERAFHATAYAFRDSPKHPRTIEARLLYGRALGDAGKAALGVDQLAQAVSDASEVFGPSSRMVGFYSLPLVALQLETGDVQAALRHSQVGVTIIAQHADPASFRYANALFHRGMAWLAARRPEEALRDLGQAVITLQHVLPIGHATTRLAQANQGLALARAGRYREARGVLEPLVAAPAPPGDQSVAVALYAKGVSARLSGDPASALRSEQHALQLMAGRGADIRRMRALTEIGLAELDLGRPAQAGVALEGALRLSEHLQTHVAPDRADILSGLARVRLATGQPAAAKLLSQQAYRFWREFSPHLPDVTDLGETDRDPASGTTVRHE
jgi:serine/threonine-protein kinase